MKITQRKKVEIEAILGKRKNVNNNKIKYQVKWKDFDDSHNEWVDEDLFDEFKLLN